MYQFAKDEDSQIRQAVAKREDVPDPLKVQLSKDTDVGVKHALLQSPSPLPREAIDYMYEGGGESIYTSLMHRPETPMPMKKGILKKSVEYPINLTHSPTLERDVRKLLLNHRDYRVRREFATRGDLTKKEVEQLLGDSSAYVLVNVIGNPLVKLTEPQFYHYVKSPHRMVRMKMARLKYINDDQLLVLAKDEDPDVRGQVLSRANIMPNTLEYILKNYSTWDVSHILETKYIPYSLVMEFLERDDIDDNHMNMLFRNENIPLSTKAVVVEKYMKKKGQVPYGLIATYGQFKPVMRTAMEILRSSPRPDTMVLNKMASMKDIPREYRDSVFAMIYEHGGYDAKRKMLKNPTVNREIKNIINQQIGGYY
jgi:hypothetical protein